MMYRPSDPRFTLRQPVAIGWQILLEQSGRIGAGTGGEPVPAPGLHPSFEMR